MADSIIDQSAFLSDKFDVNAYANAVLAGQSYRPDDPVEDGTQVQNGQSGRGDIGAELAKLNQGIEDVTKQLRAEVASSYPLFLSHLTTSLALSDHLAPIRTSLESLSTSMDRLHNKIHVPYENLSTLVRRQQLLAQASDLSRRAARFVLVARRMEGQMERMKAAPAVKQGDGEKERELAKAALSVAELDSLLHPAMQEEADRDDADRVPLDQLDFVKTYAPNIDAARDAIIQEMEGMVINGLSDLNQPLLSSSLQTAHNLRLLPDLVSNLLADLNDAVTLRITRALDSAAIGREVAGKEGTANKYTGRNKTATEPTAATTPQWTAVLWIRLERVMEDIASCCIKVYTLEKVLKLKRDATSGLDFLEEVMKTQEEKPSFTFWTTLAKAFETRSKEAARSSSWLQQALSTGYPRLLRLFHDFFAKIAVHTDTVYTRDHQSTEAVLVLRSVATFENLYLSRSTTRMNEAVASAFAGRGQTPGAGEGVTIARTIVNELDSARFDPLLVRTVARNANRVLEGMNSRVDGLLVKDFTATSLIGPNATPAQVSNGSLVGFLYHCQFNLLFIETEFPAKVWEVMSKTILTTFTRVTTPLDAALRREFGAVINRIHRVDFSKPVDPMSMNNSGSAYMVDLIDKIGFVKSEILGRMSMGDMMKDWTLELSRYLIKTFLLHASIARPMGESGKLKLTGDMTEFEMGLSSLLSTGRIQGARGGVRIGDIGEEYLALRAFRQLLFSPPSALADPLLIVHLPPLIVMHHVIVLSPLRLPHEVNGWSEMEYYNWVIKQEDEKEQWKGIWKAVQGQVDVESYAEVHVDGEDRDEHAESQTNGQKDATDQVKETTPTPVPAKEPDSEEDWVKLLQKVIKYAEDHA